MLDAVILARSGNHDAFELLARRAAPRLEAVARLILRDADCAKDAVQDTLIRAWRDLPGLREPAAFGSWLDRLLVRACMDAGREQQRILRLSARVTEPSVVGDALTRLAARDEMERAFAHLKREQRAILALRYYADLSLEDTALALCVPIGTAKSRLHRALESLQAALDIEARAEQTSSEGLR